MILSHHAYSLLTPFKAHALASYLNAEDDGWSYTAIHDPKGLGLSFVQAHDESGILLGNI